MTEIHALSGAYAVDAVDDDRAGPLRAAPRRVRRLPGRGRLACARPPRTLAARRRGRSPRRAARSGAGRDRHGAPAAPGDTGRPPVAARNRRRTGRRADVRAGPAGGSAAGSPRSRPPSCWPWSASAQRCWQPWQTDQAPHADRRRAGAPGRRRRRGRRSPSRAGRSATLVRSGVRGPRGARHRGHAGRTRRQGLPAVVRRARRRHGLGRGDAAEGRPDGAARRGRPTPPPAPASPSSRPVGRPARPATRSRCSTSPSWSRRHDRTRSRATQRGGDRLRRRRADRRPRARPRSPDVTLYRGRRPARRPRRHPPGRRRWRHRHRLHRAQRAHLPHAAPAVRRARRARPRTRRCRCRCATRPPGSSTPARWGPAGCSRRPRTCATRRTCGCSSRSPASTAGPAPACSAMAATSRRSASSWPAAASRRTSAATSPSRWSRRSGRATPTWRWTTRPATCSRFLDHHGMLGVFGSPQWRTVTGGSREYVAARRRRAGRGPHRLQGHLGARDRPTGVEVTDGNGTTSTFDAVVIATHPDQALSMLAEPTAPQREVLGALPYSANLAHLHTDTSLLPRRRGRAASWNYLRPRAADGPGHGHLRPDPADAAADAATRLPGHPGRRRTGSTRPRSSTRWSTSTRSTPRPRSPRSAGCPRSTPSGSRSPAPTTAGASTRTAPARAWPPRSTSARRGPSIRVAARPPVDRPVRHHDHAHPPYAVPPRLHPPQPHLAGRPRRPARPRRCSARFEARDHLGDPEPTIRENVERVPGPAAAWTATAGGS